MASRDGRREALLRLAIILAVAVLLVTLLVAGGCQSDRQAALIHHLSEENARLTAALEAAGPPEEALPEPVERAAARVAVAVEGNTEAIREGLDQDASFYEQVLAVVAPGGGGILLTVLGFLGYQRIRRKPEEVAE